MGTSESKICSGIKRNYILSDFEKEDKIKYIYIICVPCKGRNWHIAGKVLLTLTVIGGIFNGIIPIAEHHGLIFETYNGDYYYTQWPKDKGAFLKDTKQNSIDSIIDGCVHYDNRKYWVRLKARPYKDLKIKEVFDSEKSIRWEYYNVVNKNCQSFCNEILNKLPGRLKILGVDSLDAGGGLSYMKGGDLII